MAERRTHPRFPFSSRLEVRYASYIDETTTESMPLLEATAVDVSVTGFCFRSPRSLEVGDLISVTLPDLDAASDVHAPLAPHAPNAGDLAIFAVVRRVEGAAHGYLIGAERHFNQA